jgi:hypothetical protein
MPRSLRRSTAHATQQRQLFAWSLLCGVLLCGAMAAPYYLGRVYTSDDLWAYHLPVRQFYAQCLAHGDRFDWMPSLYSGFYLTGEGQAGTYHPLHWLLYRCLPLRAAFDLELLLNYPLLLAGTYFFLRRHLRRAGAMFGALVFAFSGFNLLHFVHPNAVAIVAHVPWLLLAINVAASAGHRVPGARSRAAAPVPLGKRQLLAEVSIPLLTASQLLLGYPQYTWFSLLAEAMYALLLWRAGGVSPPITRSDPTMPRDQGADVPRSPWGFFCRLAALKFLGLLIGAVQVLPTLDALQESDRQLAGADFAHQGALHVLNVLQLIGPYLFRDRVVGGNTHEFGLYFGAVPVALLAWLVIRWKALRGKRLLAAAALCCAGLALWLALGRAGLLYSLQTHLPVIGKFRLPARYLVLVHLALAAAVAVAFADLAHYAGRVRTAASADMGRAGINLGILWRLTALSALTALAAGCIWGDEHVQGWPLRLIGPCLLAAATLLIGHAVRGARWALPALIVLSAADLGLYGCTYAIWPSTYSLETALATVPEPDGDTIATELRDPAQPALRVGNQMLLKGWRQLDGYAGLEPARQLDYRDVKALRVAGVERVLRSPATESIPGLLPLDRRWLKVPDPLPAARVVEHFVKSDDPRRDLPRTDVENTALVDRHPMSPFAGTLSDFPPRIDLVAARPGRIIVSGESCQPQLLVLAERFHAGWQATVNGIPVDVVRTNGEFLGCPTAPIRFVADFEFRPASLRYGKWLTAIGLMFLFNYGVVRVAACRAGPRGASQSVPCLPRQSLATRRRHE